MREFPIRTPDHRRAESCGNASYAEGPGADDEGSRSPHERSAASERLPDRLKEREDDREHVAGTPSGSPRKFNWLNQYGVFGRDS
jgi:hypothetical protein